MHRAPDIATAQVTDEELERATSRALRELEAHHLATGEVSALVLGEGQPLRLGSKPLLQLSDASGRRYVLKIGAPDLMAAEQAAYELRKLGARPCIPARVVRLELPEIGAIEGLLKPFIEFDADAELDTDTRSWTELQRLVILREHAWDWFLDNLDTNTSQYALLGPDLYPVNIDWDRSFSSDAQSQFSRFAKYKRTLPNARTFLYADYVEGRVELAFSVLRTEARRIRRLPASQVRQLVAVYASVRFEGPVDARKLVERVLRRQRRIEDEVTRFIRRIKAERKVIVMHEPKGLRERTRLLAVIVWNHSQVALNMILRGPIGSLGRQILKLARTRSLRLLRAVVRRPRRVLDA
jgi:hypothetical protein